MAAQELTGYQAGIDVGGTKTMFCITGANGDILLLERRSTAAHGSPGLFFDWLFVELKHLLQGISLTLKQLEGIGIGFPGVIGDTEGQLSQAPALPWPVADIRPVIRRYYEGRLYLDNDVNLALLGECWKGAAAGKKHVLMVTVGTGIGSAMLLNGRLYKGANNAAGEAGYMVVDVGLARSRGSASGADFGPLEAVASGSGITALARARFADPAALPASRILTLAGGKPEEIETRHVLQAAAEGDYAALEIMDKPLEHLAAGIASAVVLLNPQLVVLGGGVAASGDYYMNEIRNRVNAYLPYPVDLEAAKLGNTAGAVGAVAAAANILW
ncbi:ROK family protein [Paenibacillus sp. FSL M7-1046]|uniref:ROK family protein n=1 Tax=Paenibacillus sp. FSL M7-1046 TaxID=2975315 RepID=UPI0030F7A469